MKKILLALLTVAACFMVARPAKAQTYGTVSPVSSQIYAVITNGTTQSFTTNNIVDTRYNRNITISIAGKANSAAASTLALVMGKSTDGTTNTLDTIGVTNTLNIPTNAISITNVTIDMGAAGYAHVLSLTAGSASVTNAAVTIALKPGQ